MSNIEIFLLVGFLFAVCLAIFYGNEYRAAYQQGFADGGKFRSIVRERAVWAAACEAQRVECANQFSGMVASTRILNTPDAEFDATA